MSDLNQYELSRVLGSRMSPVKPARFGNFGLLEASAEAVKSLDATRDDSERDGKISYEQDRVIVQAFEEVRNGASTDALLWDRKLLERFVKRCHKLGIAAPPKVLNRRLINVRKNKSRYAKKGISFSPTTRNEAKPSIVPEYAPIVEFALVRIRYRHGASIDDILLDPELCESYERQALEIAPELSPEDLRRAALYIRKTRFIKKREEEEIQSLDLGVVERALTSPIALADIAPDTVPTEPGLVEVDEEQRHLYVTTIRNLRPVALQLASGSAFRIVQSVFWTPDPRRITLRYVTGTILAGVNMHKWEHRLITDLDPLFNWPMHKGQRMAA